MYLSSDNKFRLFLLEKDRQFNIISVVLSVILLLAGIILTLVNDIGVPVLGSVAGLTGAVLCIYYPRAWLYGVVAFIPVYFLSSSDGLSLLDVMNALFYNGAIFIWFFFRIIICKERLIRNTADWLIVAFFVLMVLNCGVAMLHGVEFINWFREYILFILTLYYFPFREYFGEKKDLQRLIFVFGAAMIIVDFGQYYMYYKLLSKGLVYAYQLGHTSRINQSVFTAVSLAGIIFYFYVRKPWQKIFILACVILTIVALITTFSRTFWLVLLAEIPIILIYLKNKDRIRLLQIIGMIAALIVLTAAFFLKDYTKIVFEVVGNRFTSVSKGKDDVSVNARFVEYTAAWKKIKEFPIGGNGLAKKFVHYEPIEEYTTNTFIIHNGYIYLTYRLGFPLTLFYFIPLIYYIIKAEKYARKVKDPLYRFISLSSLTSLILMIIANMSSAQFVYRDGIFVMVFAYAFIGIAEGQYLREHQNDAAIALPEPETA